MKNSKMMIGACALAISLGASAQTQYDAARLMGGELNGTARFEWVELWGHWEEIYL